MWADTLFIFVLDLTNMHVQTNKMLEGEKKKHKPKTEMLFFYS